MSNDPIALMFGDMEKLAPGDDTETLRMLSSLPHQTFQLVVDAGCGSGRQTLVLAKALNVTIHALDTYPLFLDELRQRAHQLGLGQLVRTYYADIQAIPDMFRDIDLLWSEGAAYTIGFENALTSWATAIKPGGCLVVSELSWLSDRPPAPAVEFFRSEYPDMRSLQENIAIAEAAGYRVLDTHMLPPETWVDGFYDVLEPRARALLSHADSSVREYAATMLTEIDIFNQSEGSYGYAFHVLQRP